MPSSDECCGSTDARGRLLAQPSARPAALLSNLLLSSTAARGARAGVPLCSAATSPRSRRAPRRGSRCLSDMAADVVVANVLRQISGTALRRRAPGGAPRGSGLGQLAEGRHRRPGRFHRRSSGNEVRTTTNGANWRAHPAATKVAAAPAACEQTDLPWYSKHAIADASRWRSNICKDLMLAAGLRAALPAVLPPLLPACHCLSSHPIAPDRKEAQAGAPWLQPCNALVA